MICNMMRSMMWNKVDESVLQIERQIDQSDKIVSQAKGGINSLGKEQLPGQDCGCRNSGDEGAGDRSAVCDCVVGKSGGDDFQGEKRDSDCCDDLNGIYRRTSRTDQDNVGSASKLSAVDLKDLCLSFSTFDGTSNHESLMTVSDSLPWMTSGEIVNTGPNNSCRTCCSDG
ncbi:hypothetical protein Bpfe_010882 [Biomphalaria pfeifferi]|uniref:Uncharacterized protein n=1 Tax=Biomphalaria pfeifferi TaxID=112525 RepID=A0AAD8BRW8_BIOPF|nr:hypothetical protein Bpfe_010882 [Biomphalaria pfeifferi]